jgi:hypothetical protein
MSQILDNLNLFNLAGNVLALLGLSLKTIYDLVWNPLVFRRELQKLDPLDAARRKRDRTDKTTVLVFIILAVSYVLFIIGDLR